MKYCLVMILFLSHSALSLTTCSSQSLDENGTTAVGSPAQEIDLVRQDPMDAMGHRFLTALQENDFEKYHACWLRIPDMEALIKNPPPEWQVPSLPSKEQFDQMLRHSSVSKRDEFLRLTFPILRRALVDRCGDVAELALSDVIANNVSVQNGLKVASSLDVVLSSPGKLTTKYHIDHGAFINERWYFLHRPDHMLRITTVDGDTTMVSFGEYATKDETAKLKVLEGP